MNIKLFMCFHNSFGTVPPLYIPIQCGAANTTAAVGAVADNTGDNISEKNREYCELTAHYHAWKNVSADYYGFCHYRRFLGADIKTRYPYIVKGSMADKERDRLLGSEIYWLDMIPQYDMIVPRSEDMGLPVFEHYTTAAHHYKEDLELFLQIMRERAPQLNESASEYLAQDRQYFCNMFIMKKEFFDEYCSILFPVLEEFDAKKKRHGDFQSDRTDGYLGEIFTGIFIRYCYRRGAVIRELPRIDVDCSAKKRAGYLLLPPESKRRFFAKKIVKKMKGN